MLCLAGAWRPVSAQQTTRTAPSLFVPADGIVGSAQPALRASTRDSLKNGGIVGAIVGALAVGTVGAVICKLYQEEGGASCLGDTLRGALIGAAIGTGVGVAVDAVLPRHDATFPRHTAVTVRIAIKF
jgi:predicted lipid-binding transport protein (Tim44 family)